MNIPKYDTFLHTKDQLIGARRVVTLCYQGFCDPCQAMKPFVEDLAKRYGFYLIRIDLDGQYPPEVAGEALPALRVFIEGKPTPALTGARTRREILAYLKHYGVFSHDAPEPS